MLVNIPTTSEWTSGGVKDVLTSRDQSKRVSKFRVEHVNEQAEAVYGICKGVDGCASHVVKRWS